MRSKWKHKRDGKWPHELCQKRKIANSRGILEYKQQGRSYRGFGGFGRTPPRAGKGPQKSGFFFSFFFWAGSHRRASSLKRTKGRGQQKTSHARRGMARLTFEWHFFQTPLPPKKTSRRPAPYVQDEAWPGATRVPNAVLSVGIIGSAEALHIVREVLLVREREIQRKRERDRRKWRHHCSAKIGDEFTLSLAKNSHNWRWAYTFPCQKFARFVSPFTLPVSPFTERSPWWRWNSQWVHTFHCQKFFRPQALFRLFQMARAARRVIENPRQMIKSCPVLFVLPIEKLNQINTKNYWK